MSCTLSEGYIKKCKDSIGGVRNVWLFSFVKYSRRSVERQGIELVSFPNTVLYKFNTLQNADFTETTNFGRQGERFDQSLTISFSKIDNVFYFDKLRKGYLRAVIEDNNRNLWLLGAYNGLEVTNYQKQTGGGKNTLNGYNLTLTGTETVEALYMDSIDIIESSNMPFLTSSSQPASTSLLISSTYI